MAHAWYLVHAKPRQEDTALANLARQGFEAFLPRMRRQVRHAGRWRERVEALFPRYLFVSLDPETHDWAPIRSTVGVSSLVRFGDEPARVPPDLRGHGSGPRRGQRRRLELEGRLPPAHA